MAVGLKDLVFISDFFTFKLYSRRIQPHSLVIPLFLVAGPICPLLDGRIHRVRRQLRPDHDGRQPAEARPRGSDRVSHAAAATATTAGPVSRRLRSVLAATSVLFSHLPKSFVW